MIPFSDYFNQWLYGKKGYYSEFRPIGKEGDFYTAVSTTPLFGGVIAMKILKLLEQQEFDENHLHIVEIGAHKGFLTADVAQFLYTFRPELLDKLHFVIVERFETIRTVQKNYLREAFGESLHFSIVPSLDEISISQAFIFANEIFDAFACELIHNNTMVYVDEHHKMSYHPLTPHVTSLCERYAIHEGEVPLGIAEFAQMLGRIPTAYFLTFDYGENYPLNHQTLRIFHNHHVENFLDINPCEYFGKADLTYTVNFQVIIDEFSQQGWEKVWFKRQMDALVELGLPDLLSYLAQHVPHEIYLKEVAKIHTLISPALMGEIFKGILFKHQITTQDSIVVS